MPLQVAVEFVTKCGLSPETITSRLAKPLGGRLSNNVDSLEIIGADRWVKRTASFGYKLAFSKKPPVQRKAHSNPLTSADAAAFLDKEVKGLLDKGAIK